MSTTQGWLHTGNPLTVTIIHPSGYSCGDHYLTRGTNGLTYSMCSLMWHPPTKADFSTHDRPVAFDRYSALLLLFYPATSSFPRSSPFLHRWHLFCIFLLLRRFPLPHSILGPCRFLLYPPCALFSLLALAWWLDYCIFIYLRLFVVRFPQAQQCIFII